MAVAREPFLGKCRRSRQASAWTRMSSWTRLLTCPSLSRSRSLSRLVTLSIQKVSKEVKMYELVMEEEFKRTQGARGRSLCFSGQCGSQRGEGVSGARSATGCVRESRVCSQVVGEAADGRRRPRGHDLPKVLQEPSRLKTHP